jgi:hypothetical protein
MIIGVHISAGRQRESLVSKCGSLSGVSEVRTNTGVGQREEQAQRYVHKDVEELAKGIKRSQSIKV